MSGLRSDAKKGLPMRLVTLEHGAEARPGVHLGDDILDLKAAAAIIPEASLLGGSLRAILANSDSAFDLLRRVVQVAMSRTEQLRESGGLIALSSVKLLAPIPDPRLILSCGINYRAHIAEMGGTPLREPLAFLKSPNAVVGPDEPIILPISHPNMVDWEAEFSAVIGRPCHNVSVDEALDHVAGYVMINDVSARDWARSLDGLAGHAASQAWDQNILGKQFPTFCPMGPALALKDEVADPDAVAFRLSVNGVTMQDASTEDLVFGLAALIAHYSRFFRFLPGDVITTGSPAGVGMGRKPPIFLKPGDTVEIQAEGIGTFSNPVIAEVA